MKINILIAGCLAVLNCACSSDKNDPGPDLEFCTLKAEGDILLGEVTTFSGSLATFGPYLHEAFALALQEINQSGGIGGRTLGYIQCDTGSQATNAIAAVDELLENFEIAVIIGPVGSAETVAVSGLTVPRQVVLISPTNQLPTISHLDDDGYIFRSCAAATIQIPIATDWFLSQGWTKMFLIHQDDAYGNGLFSSFLDNFEAGGGQVEEFTYTTEEDNYAENAVNSARASFPPDGPDVIEMAGFVEDGAIIVDTAQSEWQQNGPQWVVFNGMKRPEFVRKIGGTERAVGLMGSCFTHANNSDYEAFRANFEAAYGNEPYDFSWNAYDAVYLASIAMALSDDPGDGSQIRDNLAKVSSGTEVHPGEWSRVLELLPQGEMNYQGASGPVDFDANGDVLQRVSTWEIVEGGTFDSQCWEPTGVPCQ